MSVRKLLPIALLLAAWSIRCAKSPSAPTGEVSVTVTTSTTTTIPIPELTAGTVRTSPTGNGVVAATIVNFQLASSGGVPPYTVAWKFGDGEEGAGTAPAHLYMSTGSFTAVATVTDSRGTTAQASAPVEIRSVTGRWIVTFQGAGPSFAEAINLVQNGAAVVASINHDPGNEIGFGSGSGNVSNPRSLAVSVSFAAAVLPFAPFAATFTGRLDDALTTWTGTATGYPNCPCGFIATRNAAEVMSLGAGLMSSPVSGR